MRFPQASRIFLCYNLWRAAGIRPPSLYFLHDEIIQRSGRAEYSWIFARYLSVGEACPQDRREGRSARPKQSPHLPRGLLPAQSRKSTRGTLSPAPWRTIRNEAQRRWLDRCVGGSESRVLHHRQYSFPWRLPPPSDVGPPFMGVGCAPSVKIRRAPCDSGITSNPKNKNI